MLNSKCPICDCFEKKHKVSIKHKQSGKNFKVFACTNCGLGVIKPMPDKNELAGYYKNYYTEKGPANNKISLKELLKRRICKGIGNESKIIRYLCSILASISMQVILPYPFGQRRILDIGCGYGRLLDLFQMYGWETYGVELLVKASQLAMEKGHIVFTGELLEARYRSKYFSAIVLCHSLEHMFNPMEVLSEIFNILSPGGILVVEVPNTSCADASFYGHAWDSWALPYHLYHWTPCSLRKAVIKAGFTPIRCRYKIPTLNDLIVNSKNLDSIKNKSLQKTYYHHLMVMLLGHLCIKKWHYGHYMALYAQKS